MDVTAILARFLDEPRVARVRAVLDTYGHAAGGLLANGLAFSALFAAIPTMLLVLGLAGTVANDPAPLRQAQSGAARPNVDPDFSLMPELFPKAVRPHVRAFGRFVRLADNITDNAGLSRADKLARLGALEQGLDGHPEAAWSDEALGVVLALRQSLEESGLPAAHARHILQACRRDAEGGICATWADLMVYCQFAAAPIGRHMDSLHRPGSPAGFPESCRDYPGFRSRTYLPAWCIVEWVGQSIVQGIWRPACGIAHDRNDLLHDITAFAAGSTSQQILNRSADLRFGIVLVCKIPIELI